MVMKILSRVSSQKRIALFFMFCLHLMPVGGGRWMARGSIKEKSPLSALNCSGIFVANQTALFLNPIPFYFSVLKNLSTDTTRPFRFTCNHFVSKKSLPRELVQQPFTVGSPPSPGLSPRSALTSTLHLVFWRLHPQSPSSGHSGCTWPSHGSGASYTLSPLPGGLCGCHHCHAHSHWTAGPQLKCDLPCEAFQGAPIYTGFSHSAFSHRPRATTPQLPV